MNNITEKLDQLEAHLQMLIEGRIAGLLPDRIFRDVLIQRMIAAMEAGTQRQADGSFLAPDRFYIRIQPQYASQLPQRDSFLGELAEILQRAGDHADLRFAHPPKISFTHTDEAVPDQIDVLARVSQESLGETHALEIETDNDPDNLPSNAFLIVNGTQVFTLEQGVINIGRRASNHLVINDPRISRQHAQLRAVNKRYVIFDLDSTGGTFVNDRRVTQSTLQPGDVISLAGIPLVYAQEKDVPLGKTEKYIPEKSSQDDLPTKGGVI